MFILEIRDLNKKIEFLSRELGIQISCFLFPVNFFNSKIFIHGAREIFYNLGNFQTGSPGPGHEFFQIEDLNRGFF